MRARIPDVGDVAAVLLPLLDAAHQQQFGGADDGRRLQFDPAPVGEVDGLLLQRGHGADAEIALLLSEREAGEDRLRIAIGDQLLHAFDRHGAVDTIATSGTIGPAVIDVEPERLRDWELSRSRSMRPITFPPSLDHREARDAPDARRTDRAPHRRSGSL